MILSTTHATLDGYRVEAYLGIVFGEAIVGANLFRDLFASIRDIVGGGAGPTRRSCAGPGSWPSRSWPKRPAVWGRTPWWA